MTAANRSEAAHRTAAAEVLDHPDHCVACHSCELACSYHHLGLFQPSRASVSIERDADSGIISRRRWYADEEARIACDFCAQESDPQCAKFCSRPAVRRIVEGRRQQPTVGSPVEQLEEGDDATA